MQVDDFTAVIANVRHIAQVDRATVTYGDDDIANVIRGFQCSMQPYQFVLILVYGIAYWLFDIGAAQHGMQLG